ncbi:MAG: response regulator [Gammaproteobacteria bacterium]
MNQKCLDKSCKTQKILIVEDNPVVQAAIQIMSKKLGYEIDIAHDGKTALAMYSLGYKLILMDIDLPDMSGIDITKKIRETEIGRSIYIVAITSHTKEEYLQKCLDAGMDGFSHKPASVEELQKIISHYVSNVHFH